MSVVNQFLWNDPTTAFISTYLRDEEDATLAQALEQNPYIHVLVLNCGGIIDAGNWPLLCHVIATRANLYVVKLSGLRLEMHLGNEFLQAIQQNRAIQVVQLCHCTIGDDMASFLDTATFVTTLSLENVGFGSDAVRNAFTSALQRNTNIQQIELAPCAREAASDLVPILECLRDNVSMRTLKLIPRVNGWSETHSRATQQLIQSSTSIQSFELSGWDTSFRTKVEFRIIAEGLINSARTTELNFFYCEFGDEALMGQLRSIIQSKPTLSHLTVEGCEFRGLTIHEALAAALRRPDSSLRRLRLAGSINRSMDPMIPNAAFETVLTAAASSKLEHLDLEIPSEEYFLVVITSIPLLKVKELVVLCIQGGRYDRQDTGRVQHSLLRAIRHNYSLRSLQATVGGSSAFVDDQDEQRLGFYMERNKRLAQWVENPDSVPRSLWFEALHVAMAAGEDKLLRSLQKTLGFLAEQRLLRKQRVAAAEILLQKESGNNK